MSKDDLVPAHDALVCPVCKGELRFFRSGKYGGRRFHAEVHVYECPKDGPVYLTREGLAGPGPDNVAGGDDSLTPAPSKPAPILSAGAIAIPEPPQTDPSLTTHGVS
jgi:uncharacterized protein YbaR (Trm112 family)